jgi:hypothetical protein
MFQETLVKISNFNKNLLLNARIHQIVIIKGVVHLSVRIHLLDKEPINSQVLVHLLKYPKAQIPQ